MIYKIVCFVIFSSIAIAPINAQSWQHILEEYAFLMTEHEKDILFSQQKAFADGSAPVITASAIKEIPIDEGGERLLDLRAHALDRVTMLPDAQETKPFSAPYFNSGLANASKMRQGIAHRLALMITHFDALAEQFGYKPGRISIKVFEGLRDIKTQEQLFTNKMIEIQSKNPALSQKQVEQETCKWVSPVKNNVPVHSTGAAVDIRLWDEEKNDFIDMGPFGVIWGSNPGAPTFSEIPSDAQKRNRLFCLLAAIRAGLVNYVYEFWHFSAGDRYASYWLEKEVHKRYAIYGAVAEVSVQS